MYQNAAPSQFREVRFFSEFLQKIGGSVPYHLHSENPFQQLHEVEMIKGWVMGGFISTVIAIGLVLIILRPDSPDADEVKPNSFGADLTFQFECKGKTNPPSEQAIEGFMTAKGFKPLDKVKAGAKLTPDFSWMHLDTVGTDSTRHEIAFKGFADQPDSYSVSLYSEPPTTRSKDLEKDLMEFTEKTLGCKNSKVAHVENPAGAKDLYDKFFGVTESWYQQASGVPAPSTAAAPASATK